MNLDPDPAIFVIDLQDGNKKLIFSKFFCLFLFEGSFTFFFKDKSHKTEGTKVLLPIFA
jgi:hypothetical protein